MFDKYKWSNGLFGVVSLVLAISCSAKKNNSVVSVSPQSPSSQTNNNIQLAAATPCSADVIAKIIEPKAGTVVMNCIAKLDKSTYAITKKIEFAGGASSGAALDCNGSTIGNTSDYKGLVHIHSIKKADTTWDRPSDIKVSNCKINGRIVISGMDSQSNLDSSHKAGHTLRSQNAAPTNITLDKLVITVNVDTALYVTAATKLTLSNSELKGKSKSTSIYLDAETAYNKIINNNIHVSGERDLFHPDRELMAIDGSAYNLIANNTFSELYRGGIFLYRNCGEQAVIWNNGKSSLSAEGAVRHQTPSNNQIINNVFVYVNYSGSNPAIFVGSRNGNRDFCDKDKMYNFGSGASDLDFASDNVIAANQFYKFAPNDVVKIGSRPTAQVTYLLNNETITAVKKRQSGCVVDYGITKKYVEYGQVSEGQTCASQTISPKVKVVPLKRYWLDGVGHRYSINDSVPSYNGKVGKFERIQGYILNLPYESATWKSKGGVWDEIYNCVNSKNDGDNYISRDPYCELNGYRLQGMLGYIPSKVPANAPATLSLYRCYQSSYPEHYLSESDCAKNPGSTGSTEVFIQTFAKESFLTELLKDFP